VKPARFDYVRAESVEEVLGVLRAEGAEARILAGGQSFMPMLNMRLARPRVLVDIMPVTALADLNEHDREIVIGAGVRQARLLASDGLAHRLPLVAQALPHAGHAQTRSRGTVCGSIAHADPSAELPLCLVTLGGHVHLRSASRRRKLPASEFFTGMMTTARADDELIEAVSFPLARTGARAEGTAFREIARRHGDFAIVACAARVSDGGIRLAVGGVADVPQARDFPCLDGSALDDALNGFAWDLNARDDMHASARYRRELVRRIGRATIEEADRCRA
jgi:2-furoyl-CoA dehydrogenase FAD binding subunit